MSLSIQDTYTSKYKDVRINFKKPSKDKLGCYMAKLKTPIKVELPKLEIYSVGNKVLNGVKEYQIWYTLDLDNTKHKELLELLYYLEEKAIENSYNNSKDWFNGKQLSVKSLENLFLQVYDSDDESKVIIKLSINNKDLLPLFEEDHFSTIVFHGIRFFTNNFGYSVTVEKVNKLTEELKSNFSESVENGSENSNKEIRSQNINLLDYLNDDKKIDNSSKEVITDDVVDNLAEDISNDVIENNLKNHNQTKKNNKEKNNIKKVRAKDKNSIQTKVSQLSKIEIKSVINNKRETVKRYFLNAERANRAAENLKLKAMRANNDLKKYEELYSQFSDSEN